VVERSLFILTAAERSLRGRIGAYKLYARHDPRELTSRVRAVFLSRFEEEVDPEGVLPGEEWLRRAEATKKAYFTRLALKSSSARRMKR